MGRGIIEGFLLTFAATPSAFTNPDRGSRNMFERLQKTWRVGGLQLFLIICTFAIGGSLTGFAGKKIMNLLSIQQDWLWAIIYILLITILWPLAVLVVSIPFGQFAFFIKYIRKIGAKLGVGRPESGDGSNQS
ncbi:MAG TPA: DUF6787 family protein [Chitinophagaceae bacterium]|nr:DUF6787 family protein [Chitinophagaceae bacterium]